MWSVISFTLPNYLQIIFHSLHTITALLAEGKRVRERESLPVVPSQVHAFSHRIIVVVAHHCSTVTHPWIDRTTMSIHLLTTTTMTRSDHLYLDGDLDLAANLVTIASLFLSSLLSLPLSFLDLVATSTSLFLAATTSTLSLFLIIKCWVCGIEIFVLLFVSLGLYIGIFIIIFVWKMGNCEKLVENVFFRAFSRTQAWKYFPKHFLEYNQTPENIFYFPFPKIFSTDFILPS